PGDDEQFVAAGGPIQVTIGGVDIDATEFGDSFGMFCDPYPDDTDPTGLASLAPDVEPANPLVAQGTASIPPPAPSGPGPYELFCPDTPVGDIAINDVTSSATLSPAHPAPGQQFTVTGYQSQVTLPSDITDAAASLGNDAISGSATTTFAAEGATPASVPSGTMDFDATIPDPLPAQGLTLSVPAAPLDIGTFTATASPVTITQGDQVSLTLMGTGTDTAPLAQATCTAYPDDTEPSGIVPFGPDQPPIEPVLATTAPAPPPPQGTSGPYELYCPGTPVGDVALNDVVSSASLSPADPAPGQQFSVTGYQVSLALPAQIVTAAAALGNVAIQGTASALLDAGGATPPSISTGTLDFDVPIPDPVPAGGLAMTIPVPAATVGPFTATASSVTISQDTNVAMSLIVSGSTLTLSCRSYPDDSESTGIVTASPASSPEAPVVVTAAASSTTPTTTAAASGTTPTTTTVPPTTTTTNPVGAGGTTTTTAPSVQGTEATTTTAAPGTTRAPSTPARVPSSSDPVTKSASSDPAVTPATVVTAPSGSLAFTGVGSELRWLLVVGTALVVLGLALLLLVDAPRRLLVRLHRGAVAGGPGGTGDGRPRMWQPRP
ncbi:MAG TPA: hypothetical protein VMB72_13095, partial [Acidimicrobiales bacterium]|nr:hypothetical protein [Acidimicrobiales bacterium]